MSFAKTPDDSYKSDCARKCCGWNCKIVRSARSISRYSDTGILSARKKA